LRRECFEVGLAVVAPGGHDGRAEAADRLNFERVGSLGYVNSGGSCERPGGVCDAQPVVAGRGGDGAGASGGGRGVRAVVQRALVRALSRGATRSSSSLTK